MGKAHQYKYISKNDAMRMSIYKLMQLSLNGQTITLEPSITGGVIVYY